jgi:hypothetical protein
LFGSQLHNSAQYCIFSPSFQNLLFVFIAQASIPLSTQFPWLLPMPMLRLSLVVVVPPPPPQPPLLEADVQLGELTVSNRDSGDNADADAGNGIWP